ncbi:MAG: ExbD/TolR family protein [Vicinamibacterales bacterium]
MPKVQAAGSGSAPRARGRRVATNLSEINVVPLVDVMLVLLIIFMVTAPMIQRGIDVNLPVSRRATAVEGERLFVTVPSTFKADGMVFLGDEPVRGEVLQERVRQRMEASTDKQVYLRGDGTVELQDLLAVMDRLKDAGVTNVGIVAKAPGDR